MKFSEPHYVLVGPLADSQALARWAHEAFKHATVAFVAVDSGLTPLLASGLPAALVIGDMDGLESLRPDRRSSLAPRPTKGSTLRADIRKEKSVAFKRTNAAFQRAQRGHPAPDAIPLTAIRLKRDKDRSDLSVALDFCVAMKASVVYAFGFQGGRSDHDFAVHLDLSLASLRIPRVLSLGASGAVAYLSQKSSPFALSRTGIEELRSAGDPSTRSRPSKSQRKTQGAGLISVFPIGGEAKGVQLRGLRFNPPNGIMTVTSQGLSNEIRSAKIEIGVRRGRVAVFFPASDAGSTGV
jgi:thiamine pyrophosphokinase